MSDKIILYKYVPLNKYTLSMLINDELHFSLPKELNDPFDMSHFSGSNYETNIKRKEKNISICCFTKNGINHLMWSHYADSHKGICLGFEFERKDGKLLIELNHKPFTAEEVVYEEIPYVLENLKTNTDLIKGKHSEYESEYRMFSNNGESEFYFRNDSIKEIIFGIDCPIQDEYTVKNLMLIKGSAAVFFKVHRGKGGNLDKLIIEQAQVSDAISAAFYDISKCDPEFKKLCDDHPNEPALAYQYLRYLPIKAAVNNVRSIFRKI